MYCVKNSVSFLNIKVEFSFFRNEWSNHCIKTALRGLGSKERRQKGTFSITIHATRHRNENATITGKNLIFSSVFQFLLNKIQGKGQDISHMALIWFVLLPRFDEIFT